MMVNLEIKPTPGDEVRTGRVVAQHVARLWALAHVKPLLSSFSTVALEAARQTQPDLPRVRLLIDAWADDSIKMAMRLDCLAMVVNHTHLNAERIAAIHACRLEGLELHGQPSLARQHVVACRAGWAHH
jgi:glycerophosphoryl diester phosphodiesterase